MYINFDDQKLLIINIYNHNVEKGQVELLKRMNDALENFDTSDHKIIMAVDFNFIHDTKLMH